MFDTRSGRILSFLLPLIQEGQLSVTVESIVNFGRLGGLTLTRKSVVRLTWPQMFTVDVKQQNNNNNNKKLFGADVVVEEVCVCGVVERGCSYIRKFCTV